MPKTMPDIIKKYKSVSVASWRIGMNDSGVKVQEGDYFTILAEGEINIWPSKGKDYIRDPYNRLLFKVGKDSFARIYYGPELINFQEDGNIYPGYISGSDRLGWANPLITLKPNGVFELADK